MIFDNEKNDFHEHCSTSLEPWLEKVRASRFICVRLDHKHGVTQGAALKQQNTFPESLTPTTYISPIISKSSIAVVFSPWLLSRHDN